MPIKLRFPRIIFSWNDWGGEWFFIKWDPSKILVEFKFWSLGIFSGLLRFYIQYHGPLQIHHASRVITVNPLSPNFHIQILQTGLYTFPESISWENLIKYQCNFPLGDHFTNSHTLFVFANFAFCSSLFRCCSLIHTANVNKNNRWERDTDCKKIDNFCRKHQLNAQKKHKNVN